MDSKNLSLALISANSTEELKQILGGEGLWDDHSQWKPLGGSGKSSMNTASIIQNQQASPLNAIDELPVNGIDSLLTLEAKKRGIDVEDPQQAPANIREAGEIFYGIPEGRLSNLDPSARSKLADNLGMMATGIKGTSPSLSIWDKGEGQSPEFFEGTILSVAKSNKLNNPFVQGKMNQGSTGCLPFSGPEHLKFVISKKNPAIKTASESSDWTYTIIRRLRPKGSERMSTYVFLAPNGNLLQFKGDPLPILPKEYPKSYGKNLDYGTFVKVYDYKIPGLNTIITLDFNNRMSSHLISPALPIKLYERRSGYNAHSYEAIMSGLEVRLEDDRNNNVEPNFPVSGQFSIGSETINYEIVALNREATKKGRYKKDEGIIFEFNGQGHASIPSSFYSRKKVNMSYIKDSILLRLDCSNLSPQAFEDLFMSSRDRLKEGDFQAKILETLEIIVSNHPSLRQLREERQRVDTQNKMKDGATFKSIYENIVKTQPNLSKLMMDGFRLSNPFNVLSSSKKKFMPKKYPSYFKLLKHFDEKKPKLCEFSRMARIQFESDVENNYFNRTARPGKVEVLMDGVYYPGWGSLNGFEGVWTLNLNLPNNSKPNTKHEVALLVSDSGPNQTQLKQSFKIEVIPNITKPKNNGRGKRKGQGGNKRGNGKKPSKLDFPNIQYVEESDWGNFGFDKKSGLLIKEDGNGNHIYFINIDNINLKHEQKVQSTADPEVLKHQYSISLAIFGMSLVMDYDKNRSTYQEIGDIEKLSRLLSVWFSPVALPVVRGLGELGIS